MKKSVSPTHYDIQTVIRSNEAVAESHYLLSCKATDIARHARSGQFVHVQISQGALLRRPFTIYTADGGMLTMLYQVIGDGTRQLSEMVAGAPLRLLGPLGNTFRFTPNPDPAILVGGGAGIASLMLLAAALRQQDIETLALVGAQHRNRLLSVHDLDALGIPVQIATDDGSVGHHGYVTDLLADLLRTTPTEAPVIYACGPHGMLSAVAKVAADFSVPAQVAMENRMGCALGVCLGCVCPVRVAPDRFEYQRVCTEGPVFGADAIVWDV